MNRDYVTRHMCIGWWSLLAFLTLGGVLETLHGFKVGWYLDVSNEARRLMWTLAHAHGTLLGLLHIAFATTLRAQGVEEAPWRRWASSCLTGATILLPGGFFLGGLITYGGDPGLGVLLAPPGAALLVIAVLLTAKAVSSAAVGQND